MGKIKTLVECFFPDVLVDIQREDGKTIRFGRAETLLIMDAISDEWKLVNIYAAGYGRAVIVVKEN